MHQVKGLENPECQHQIEAPTIPQTPPFNNTNQILKTSEWYMPAITQQHPS